MDLLRVFTVFNYLVRRFAGRDALVYATHPRRMGSDGRGVVVLHFAFPFLFLLSRSFKRNPRKLVLVAVLILVMRLFDLLWTIAPKFTGEHFHVSWMDVVAPIAMGGFWLACLAGS